MADNTIQLDLEVSKESVNNSFNLVDKRAAKSAQESAAVFEKSFKDFNVAFDKDVDNAFESFKKKNKDGIVAPAIGSKAVSSLADVAAGVYLVKEAFDVLKRAASATLDVLLEGDKILKTERRFEALSSAAGVASDVLGNELRAAVNGFVDDTELLNIASEAFIRIGKNAQDLPKAVGVARKAYQVFGGDIVQITDKIITATETGNSRGLRSIGLYTDLEAAVKKYAREQGTNVKFLTETQKEQARLNAILAEGELRFSAVQTKAGTTSSYLQLKTALNELNDEFSKLANSKLGGIFQTLAEYAKIVVNNLGEGLKKIRPAETVQDITFKLVALRDKAADYEKQLKSLGTGAATLAFSANLKGQLVTIKEQIANYDELRRKLGNVAAAQAAAAAKGGIGAGDAQAEQAKLEARKALLAKVQDLNAQAAASEVVLAQNEFNTFKQRADLERLFLLQKYQANEEYQKQKADLEKSYADIGLNDTTLMNQGREALEAAHVNKLLALRQNYLTQKKQITNEEAADITTYADAVNAALTGISEGLKMQTTSMKASLKDLGKAFVTTFKSQATNAIFAFAQGSKNAEEAAAGLFTGILNAMGEMLISQGLGFILQGAAFTWAGMPNGGALMAAGAAMVAFGAGMAAISAANGGKVGAPSSEAPSAGGGAAGGTYASDNNVSDITKPVADLAPTPPKAEINVNVGQLIDRKETGMWLAEILEERFSEDGIIVRSNV
jgi:hypothetical protein